MGSVAPWHVGSSQIRDWNCVSYIGRWILYHWVTREALAQISWSNLNHNPTPRQHLPPSHHLSNFFQIFAITLSVYLSCYLFSSSSSESFKFQMKLELKSVWLPDPIFCPLCPASDFWDREQLKGFGKMCSLYPLLRLPVYNFYLLTCHNEVSKGMNALQEYSFLFSLQSRKELA